MKKADLGFICDQNEREFQEIRITPAVGTPHVSWVIILLVKLASLSCL